MISRINSLLISCLFAAGGLLVYISVRGHIEWGPLLVMGICFAVGLVPLVSRRVTRIAERFNQIHERNHWKIAIVIALAAGSYLLFTAAVGGRDFFPKWHDEHMQLLQARMMAHGRMWMPQHPLADFFETFYVLVKPVYAGVYFPGTALLYAPVIGLGLPAWLGPLMVSGAVVGLFWYIVAKLANPFSASLGALMLLGIGKFRFISIMLLSQTPMLFFGLLSIWAWLNWQRERRARWALVMGAFSGWAAITRPLDAIAYAAPIGIAMLWDLLKFDNKREILKAGVALVIGAAPFLTLQLIQDYGVTGHIFKTPYSEYLELNSPESAYLYAGSSAQPVAPTLLQKQNYDREFNQSEVNADNAHRFSRWLNWKLPIIAGGTVPTPWLLALLPIGLMLLGNRRWVLPMTSFAFVALYFPFAFMLGHYPVVAAPGIVAAILCSLTVISRSFPIWRQPLFSSLTLMIGGVAVYTMVASLPPPGDDPQLFGTVAFANKVLPAEVKTPAIVLVRFREFNSPHQEIVYNTDVVWPDDAAIIKAHDLGPDRDGEIIRYYAHTQPNRNFYLLDRGLPNLKVQPLGTARELGSNLPQLPEALAHPAEIPADETWKTKLRND